MADDPTPDSAEKPAGAHAAKKAPAAMAATPWEGELPESVKQRFGDSVLEASCYLGQCFFVVRPHVVIPLLEFLRFEKDFDYLVDLTAVDYPERPERFELVYILYSFARNERIRVKASIREGEKPESAVGVYLTADWLEREVFDMFGIEFANHPNMKRLLLPDEWQGHPLRKDHSIIGMDNEWVKKNLGIESGQ